MNQEMAARIAGMSPEEIDLCYGNWCEYCGGSGEVECYCGGDFCVCDNYGVTECPDCGGGKR